MFVTNHTLAGTLLGIRLRKRPLLAYAVGVASHLAMDALPHWGAEGDGDAWMRAARRDGLLALGVLAAVGGAVPAAPARVAFDVQPIPDPLDQVHTEVQQGKEARSRLPVELLSAAVLGGAVIRGVRSLRARRGRGRRPPEAGRRRTGVLDGGRAGDPAGRGADAAVELPLDAEAVFPHDRAHPGG